MEKYKAMFMKINSKVPVVKVLFWLAFIGSCILAYFLVDIFSFKVDFITLYGLEPANIVRERAEKQLRIAKTPEAPAPRAPQQLTYDQRLLRQHNPYLPPGVIEGPRSVDEDKVTDISGIDLIGTVYSYTPRRRTALVEYNGMAMVVVEGGLIRGTQKRVIEIGRSKVLIQEEGLMPSAVHLPSEHGLDDLSSALASNQYRDQSNWEYTARSQRKDKKKKEEEEGEKAAEDQAEKDPGKSKKKADEEAADEEEEEEESPAEPDGGGDAGGGEGGVDIGGGE